MSFRTVIFTQVLETAQQQNKTIAPLSDDLKLLASGLDSLCLAIIVARLEDELGVDPFSENEFDKLPVTFGDFIHLYDTAVRHDR